MSSLDYEATSPLTFNEADTNSTVNQQVIPISSDSPTDGISKSRKRPVSFEQPTNTEHFQLSSAIIPEQPTSQKHLSSSSIIGNFLDMKIQLQQILQTSNSQIMLQHCKSFMASHDHDIPLFSNEYFNRLKECSHVPEILQKLSPFFNWTNHSLLTAVVQVCNNPEATVLLQQFDSQVDLSLPITEYPIPQPVPSMAPYDTSSETILAIKVNAELSSFSFRQFLELQSFIQRHFQITEHSMQLIAVKSTLGIFYWMVPKSIGHLINSKIMQDPKNGVQELSIWPGTLFVNASTLQLGSLSFLSHISHTVRKFYLATYLFYAMLYCFSIHSFPGMTMRCCACNYVIWR